MKVARNFTKDLANYMSLGIGSVGAVLNGAAQVSFHCFAFCNSAIAGSTANRFFGNILNSTTGLGVAVGIDGSSRLCRVSARSTTADTTQAAGSTGKTKINYGAWTSIGLLLDYPNDLIFIYLNGRLDSQTTVTFGANFYTHGSVNTNSDAIGANLAAPTIVDTQTDGKVSEVAFWKVALGSSDFKKLAQGISANRMRTKPAVYFKLDGLTDPEMCSAGSGLLATITGSVPLVSGPPMNTSFLKYEHSSGIF